MAISARNAAVSWWSALADGRLALPGRLPRCALDRVRGRRLMRYMLALLVLLALQLAPREASAQTTPAPCVLQSGSGYTGNWVNCGSRELAYAKVAEMNGQIPADFLNGKCVNPQPMTTGIVLTSAGRYQGQAYNAGVTCGWPVNSASWSGADCPTGSTWNDTTHTCFDPSVCTTRDPLGNTNVETTAAYDSVCQDGCEYRQASGVDVQLVRDDGTVFGVTTGWEPSGDACPSNAPTAQPFTTSQECMAAPDGQTFCIKPDGQHCYSLTNGSGRQICWRPGQTGEKSAENALQVRNGGSSAATPTTPPPPGDSFAQGGGSITKTVSVGGTSITTTTTNYTTVNGTSVDGTDQSEPGDGSGSPSGGEGEDGSASGGADCEGAPITSGDPVMGMVATQAWATRCAVEAGNAANVTGDVGDCSQPFTVEGTNANAEKLRAMRAQICPGEKSVDPAGDNYGVGDDPAGDEAIRSGFFGADQEAGADGLDDVGLSGFTRVCPEMPVIEVMGATLDFNLPQMCDWIKLGGQLVLILAALASLRIMAGGGT